MDDLGTTLSYEAQQQLEEARELLLRVEAILTECRVPNYALTHRELALQSARSSRWRVNDILGTK
jgi:hypothetical protein